MLLPGLNMVPCSYQNLFHFNDLDPPSSTEEDEDNECEGTGKANVIPD